MTSSSVPAYRFSKTKVVATVGPASESEEQLRALVQAGVDVFRLNTAHGTSDWHRAVVARLRQVENEVGRPVGILMDLAGPKLRIGQLAHDPLVLRRGDRVRLVASERAVGPMDLPISPPELLQSLQTGDQVLIADGTVTLRVVESGPQVIVEATGEGEIRSRQGFNIPHAPTHLTALTEADRNVVARVADWPVDFFGLSFVRSAEDIQALRQLLEAAGSCAQIVAKIEKAEALGRLDEILATADAIMVARGDLGIEIPIAEVPVSQKRIIAACNRRGLPVITATQMLESMRTNRRPTRAEASDVANAILDGSDAVMLSAETAVGAFPVEAVQVMHEIAQATEAHWREYHPWPARRWRLPSVQAEDHLAASVRAAGELADAVQARFVVAVTSGGHTALALSSSRLATPILGITDNLTTARRMTLFWGVLPVFMQVPRRVTEYVQAVESWLLEHHQARRGERLVFVFGSHWAESAQNVIIVREIGSAVHQKGSVVA